MIKKLVGLAAWAVATVLVVGCGEDISGEADQEEGEPVAATSEALTAPSCVRILRDWSGACQQQNFQVFNGCASAYTVQIDVVSFPDTSCKRVAPGQVVTFTTQCNTVGWPLRLEARGIKRC